MVNPSGLFVLLECKGRLVGIRRNRDVAARLELSAQYQLAYTVLYIVLNRSFQRSRAKLDVIAFGCHKLLGVIRDTDGVAHVADALEKAPQFQVYNPLDGRNVQLVECDDFIQPVDELGRKLLTQALLYHVAGIRFVFLIYADSVRPTGVEAYAAAELLQLTGARVRRHDDDRIAEVHQASVAIGQSAFIQHLQQEVEHIPVCLLNLVEQHDGIRVATNSLGQLATFFIANISRRAPTRRETLKLSVYSLMSTRIRASVEPNMYCANFLAR